MRRAARIFVCLWALACAAAGSAAPASGGAQGAWRGTEAAALAPVEVDASPESPDRARAQQILDQVNARHSWIRGPYGESGREHMADLGRTLGAANAEFARFDAADANARIVLLTLDKAGTVASMCLGGGGMAKVLCQKGFVGGVRIIAKNMAVSAATSAVYNVGIEVAGEAAIAAGADPEDVELVTRGLDATISIVSLAQGMNFRSKNNSLCFVAGTPVETSDGPRAIEEIRAGDFVLGWDEATGEVVPCRVAQTFSTPAQRIWRLTLKLPDGSEESLECTPEHPFWVEGEGWTPACQLRASDRVAALAGSAEVAAVWDTCRTERVYNFEVAGTHSYFAGTGGTLVHNGCETPVGGVYSLRNRSGRVVRTGRTNDLGRRKGEHERDLELGKFKFKVEARTDVYAQQRGLEQRLHDKFKPELNLQNPISPKNPRRQEYLNAADRFGNGG